MKIFKIFIPAIIALTLGFSGIAYGALTGPTGGSGLTTPATLCQVATGVWQFCNTGDALGDASNKNAGGYFTALTVDTLTVATSFVLSGTVSGSLVIDDTNTEALLVRKDSDGGDVFIVDTTNSQVDIFGQLLVSGDGGGSDFLIEIAEDSGLTSGDGVNWQVKLSADDASATTWAYFTIQKDQLWTSTGSTKDASLSFNTLLDNSSTSALTIGSTGLITVDTGDLSLTDGRVIVRTEGTQTCAEATPDTLALNLSTSAKGRIVLDQNTEAGGDENCIITFSNGTAGEMIILELTFSGDNTWTFAAGGIHLGDTFAAADSCQDNIATPADGDALLITGIMIDGDTMALLSCQYADQ